MKEPDTIATSASEGIRELTLDTSCLTCGYNLRGLVPDGVCPECGSPIRVTLRGDRLEYADRTWLKRCASGIVWIVAGAAITAIPAGLMIAYGGPATGGAVGQITFARPIALVAAAGLLWLGTFRLARPEPNRTPAHLGRINTALQVFATTRLALIAFLYLPIHLGKFGGYVAGTLFVLAEVGLIYALGTWARHVALRVPDQRMAVRMRRCMWGLLCVNAFGLLISAASLIAFWGPNSYGYANTETAIWILQACTAVYQMTMIVFVIWWFGLLFALRRYILTASGNYDVATREPHPIGESQPGPTNAIELINSPRAAAPAALRTYDSARSRMLWLFEIAGGVTLATLLLAHLGITVSYIPDEIHQQYSGNAGRPLFTILSFVASVIACWVCGRRASFLLSDHLTRWTSPGAGSEFGELAWLASLGFWMLTPFVLALESGLELLYGFLDTAFYPLGNVISILVWTWALAGTTAACAAALMLWSRRDAFVSPNNARWLVGSVGVVTVLCVVRLVSAAWSGPGYISKMTMRSFLSLLPGMSHDGFIRGTEVMTLIAAGVSILLMDPLRREAKRDDA